MSEPDPTIVLIVPAATPARKIAMASQADTGADYPGSSRPPRSVSKHHCAVQLAPGQCAHDGERARRAAARAVRVCRPDQPGPDPGEHEPGSPASPANPPRCGPGRLRHRV